MKAVLFSGGWESVLCMLKAGRDAVPIFFDYGQPYLKQEVESTRRLAQHFNTALLTVRLEQIANSGVVFPNRNRTFIEEASRLGASDIYYGARGLINALDKYKDSNRQFASTMERELGISIHTPAMLMPKIVVRFIVSRSGVPVSYIWSSENYAYT